MKWRRALWAGAALVALGALIVFSPPYLEKLLERAGYTPGSKSASRWLADLDSPDVEKRVEAVRALGKMPGDADTTVPVLARVMLDEGRSRGERIESAFAMTMLAPATRAVVPELIKAVGDKEPGIRMDALIALMNLREAARPAVPAIVAALKDEENDTNVKTFQITIREQAAVTLGFATAGTAEGVPALTEALKTAKNSEQKRAAIRGLGVVGPEAREVVPRLRELARDPDTNLSRAAREALESITPEKK
jgi:HEAT repeat protein